MVGGGGEVGVACECLAEDDLRSRQKRLELASWRVQRRRKANVQARVKGLANGALSIPHAAMPDCRPGFAEN